MLDADQRRRERAMMIGVIGDIGTSIAMTVGGIAGGSLTLAAEGLRAALLTLAEAIGLMTLRRIHRHRLGDYEYGPGKLEQMASLSIAGGLVCGALWVAWGAVGLILRPPVTVNPAGLGVAAALGALNTYFNLVVWADTRAAAARGGTSVVMAAQLKSRLVKLVCSGVVQTLLTVAAVFPDPVVAGTADIIGALFVASFMAVIGRDLLREGLPDLLDRAVEDGLQIQLLAVLAQHVEAYARFDGLRTRRSGGVVMVEIVLGFDPGLTLVEVDGRVAAIRKAIAARFDRIDLSILATAAI